VSPPLTQLPLPAGRHQIELRYAGAGPGAARGTWSAEVDVHARESVTVSHSFTP
jgi:hypothetical protein